ncbi:MAG: response regulator [Candidatus Solibacter usitatus]|nr:response regulator [Candidatus Solibacter usitatus]
MSRILLADHSPHAQRMGERILRDEGFEVVTVTDGDTALLRLKDIEPDLVLADISLPSRNGYEICDYVKGSGKYPNTRVVLTAGPLVPLDQARAAQVRSDGFVKKPFEASMLIDAVQPLLVQPVAPSTPQETAGSLQTPPMPIAAPVVAPPPPPPAPPAPLDREQIRAAVILALEASMIAIIENVTDKVVLALDGAREEQAHKAVSGHD